MRSLVPILSLAMVSLTATALAGPPPGNSAISKFSVPMVTCDTSSQTDLNAKQRTESAVQQKLCRQLKEAMQRAADQRANAGSVSRECYTLKVYAPVDRPHASEFVGLHRRYSPRPFVLRNTCSPGAQVMALSLVPTVETKAHARK